MEINLSIGERIVISYLINRIEKVNYMEAVMVVGISEALHLMELQGSFSLSDLEREEKYSVGTETLHWLYDMLEKCFSEKGVPVNLAAYAISLHKKLRPLI